jgi:single-strand DNA-binding protein
MNALNSILIEGNVVRDPIVKETPRGTAVCTFSIASNRYYKQDDEFEEETSFFDVESWGKLADACGKGCLKGRGVRVVGRLKQDRWTGTDGKNVSKVKVIAEHVEFKPQFKDRKQDGVADASSPVDASAPAEDDERALAPEETAAESEKAAVPVF